MIYKHVVGDVLVVEMFFLITSKLGWELKVGDTAINLPYGFVFLRFCLYFVLHMGLKEVTVTPCSSSISSHCIVTK